MKNYYFISGLPRSGSTLLSAILQQNPRFNAGISDNLLSHFRSQIECANELSFNSFEEHRLKSILHATVDAYYYDIDKPVVFNTNRLWTNLLPELKALYPATKVICCVRAIVSIINSFERLHQQTPFAISSVYPKSVDLNVYTRSSSLMAEGGIVSLPYESLKSAYTGQHSDALMLIEYDLLTSNPEGVMRAAYNFIDQPYYAHDFDNVAVSYDEYDANLRMAGLHSTRKRVQANTTPLILPPDIVSQYTNLEVWR